MPEDHITLPGSNQDFKAIIEEYCDNLDLIWQCHYYRNGLGKKPLTGPSPLDINFLGEVYFTLSRLSYLQQKEEFLQFRNNEIKGLIYSVIAPNGWFTYDHEVKFTLPQQVKNVTYKFYYNLEKKIIEHEEVKILPPVPSA